MKAIVITGASTGLGLELALKYQYDFDCTILIGRNEKKLQKAKQHFDNKEVIIYPLDITKEENVKKAAKELASQYQIVKLINNAGIGYFGPLEEMASEQMETMFKTNVYGTIHMTKAFLPALKVPENSSILNIVSTAGLKGKVNESIYVASKFAVRGFTESLVKELEGQVHVAAAYMGGMDTPFWDESDHVKDKSRLRSPKQVAEDIYQLDDGRSEIVL
ncbi:SDR family NAD(P)-dependent oxidoreductase [Bacillus carboniphilus]|uniref:SDR family NAD(P)-dependent oxidoreductase n=1 Tax=Bacillus carboniphilus TaxID=86663 RepID=A0ABY9JTF4_9BACI|nr:SDR family NAD(P)-dependent oxidoreductase [Bacillus carboniphilus]WLR42671.1 SDR family NAD(P)-dependent oxidoreductase [Bacillus carboniphilus]